MTTERGPVPEEPSERKPRRPWVVLVFVVVVVVALSIYRGWLVKETPGPRTLTFYGFSALENVMNDGVFPAFQKVWKEQTGERVEFVATFAGSGTITDRIL
jgi:ABC-type sulfate transport system substrate-binding protein